MEDRQLVDELLERQESDNLDFKSGQYNFRTPSGKSKFIKDIVAMVNTPRSDSAYILVGVKEQSGKVSGVPGVEEHPDEAELGRIVQAVVDPAPRFSYRRVQNEPLDIGLIEIPLDQPVPVLPRKDHGVLRRKSVYLRRNTQNTEADREDLARIVQWSQVEREIPHDVADAPTGGWERFYRACDGFDPRRIYIAVLDREPNIG